MKAKVPSWAGKLMRIILFAAYYCVVSISAYTQQNKITLAPAIGNVVAGYLEHLPQDYYANPSKRYPLILFSHGIGEVGDGSATSLDKVWRNGLPKLIQEQKFPSSFTVGGENFSFIVISPQYNKSWVNGGDLNKFLVYLVEKYRIDTTRIYFTGLSMGGGVTWNYATSGPSFAAKLAAIVPVCGSNTPSVEKANIMAAQNLPIWALHNEGDPVVHVNNSINYVAYFNNYTPAANPQAKLTVFKVSGHDAWTKSYNPAYKEDNKNIYEWMLQFTRGKNTPATPAPSPSPVNVPPVAKAGADQSITLPANSVNMDGSGSTDSDGTISTFIWKQVAGTTVTISTPNSSKTQVTGFSSAGLYTFSLTVTDNNGAINIDTLLVTVQSAPTPAPVPVVNKAPLSNAGADIQITLPASTATLNGTASTDADGKIISYLWKELGGTAAAIANASAAETSVSGLNTSGTYKFSLTVTDDKNATATDTVLITVNPAVPTSPEPETPTTPNHIVANAGPILTTTLPKDSVQLNASASTVNGKPAIKVLWTKLQGGRILIRNSNYVKTIATTLEAGEYKLELRVFDENGASAADTLIIVVNAYNIPPSSGLYSGKTANDTMALYKGIFQYGTNPGFYANGWNDKTVAEIASKAGVRSLRLPLPDEFIQKYGVNIRKPEFDYYTKTLKMKDLTLFIEKPSVEHSDKTSYGDCGSTKVFSNIYQEIWDNGENGTPVNDSNHFAIYVYELLINYGQHVKFWEIWNEPDFSYSSGAWQIKGVPGNWWETTPKPCDLVNLKAPVYSYIRMLRIAYEVIKRYQPDALICTGGIGYESFLDVILRNTDNPDNGKVSDEYPLGGGAYFDVLSYHNYPQYFLTRWNYTTGKFESKRNSDEASFQFVQHKKNFESVLSKYGYGSSYPAKQFICTETNIPRKIFGEYIGSNEAQRNYTMKMLAESQANKIHQVYIFATGETDNYSTAGSGFNLMGLYENLKRDTYGKQKLTEQGIAFKTTSDLLFGFRYDSAATAELKVPAGVKGYAFKNDAGLVRYMLWAITRNDNNESTSGNYKFPSSIPGNTLKVYPWNYSVKASELFEVAGTTLALNGTPVIVEIRTVAVPDIPRINANAGSDIVITLPDNEVQLDGSNSNADNQILSFQWKQISGSSITITSPTTTQTKVSGFTTEGTYQFELKITDSKGNVDLDSVIVTVLKQEKPGPEVEHPESGMHTTIQLYPNPASNFKTNLILNHAQNGKGELTLFSSQGVAVWKLPIEKSGFEFRQQLQFPGTLSRGMYYLQIVVENKLLSTLKLVL